MSELEISVVTKLENLFSMYTCFSKNNSIKTFHKTNNKNKYRKKQNNINYKFHLTNDENIERTIKSLMNKINNNNYNIIYQKVKNVIETHNSNIAINQIINTLLTEKNYTILIVNLLYDIHSNIINIDEYLLVFLDNLKDEIDNLLRNSLFLQTEFENYNLFCDHNKLKLKYINKLIFIHLIKKKFPIYELKVNEIINVFLHNISKYEIIIDMLIQSKVVPKSQIKENINMDTVSKRIEILLNL